VLLLAVPLIGLQLWWAVRGLRSAEEIAGNQAVTYANMTATGVQTFLSQTERLLVGNVDRGGESYLDPAVCGQAVEALAGTFLINAFVVDRVGNIVCSARPVPPGTFAGDWEWFRGIERGPRFVTGRPVAGTLSDTWVIPLVTSIVGDDGEFAGAVAASLPLLQFAGLLPSVEAPVGDLTYTITDANDIVIADSNDPEELVGAPIPLLADPAHPLGPGQWTVRSPDSTGSNRTWGRVQMANGWSVYVGIPDEALYGPARAAATRNLLGTILILALMVALVTIGYRRIAASLDHLVSGLRVTDGAGAVVTSAGTPTEVRAVVDELNRTLEARNAAEQAERASRERYKGIFDNAVFGIYLATVDGQLLEANPALATMLRYESPEALTQAGTDALWECGAAGFEAFHRRVDQGTGEGLETSLLRADQTRVTVRMSGRATRTPDGTPAYQMIVQDITEERRKEQELRQTQKMDAIGKLAGGIAHDFNNLLVVIGGNVDLMRVSLPTDHEMQCELSQVRDAVDRAAALTARLLAFSRTDRPEPGHLEINAVLQDMEQMLGRLIGPEIELETRLSLAQPVVRIDRSEVEQIVMNLVLNARDAISSGGRVTIETRIEASPGGEGARVEGVTLSVADTGSGMDSSTLAQMFEPFYTTKPAGQGTGLGLSTVYGIVKQAGGVATAHSEPGLGTEVRVWLPLAHGPARPSSEIPREQSFLRGHERVLVVEDEELVRRFVARALTAAGYDVVLAADGQEALDVYQERPDAIDLVLTDLAMPRMRGAELGRRLHTISPRLPILYMSGYVEPKVLVGELSGRIDLVIQKPFRAAELCTRIREALDRAVDTSGV
jgi:PAS domain S-box-containing protein